MGPLNRLFRSSTKKNPKNLYAAFRKRLKKTFARAKIKKRAITHWFRHSSITKNTGRGMSDSAGEAYYGVGPRVIKTYKHHNAHIADDFILNQKESPDNFVSSNYGPDNATTREAKQFYNQIWEYLSKYKLDELRNFTQEYNEKLAELDNLAAEFEAKIRSGELPPNLDAPAGI